MFGLGPLELVIILVIILLIFGAGKLPQVFGQLGKGIKEFREAAEGDDTRPATDVPPASTKVTSSEQELQKVHDSIVKS